MTSECKGWGKFVGTWKVKAHNTTLCRVRRLCQPLIPCGGRFKIVGHEGLLTKRLGSGARGGWATRLIDGDATQVFLCSARRGEHQHGPRETPGVSTLRQVSLTQRVDVLPEWLPGGVPR
jgi:hypothetical protein